MYSVIYGVDRTGFVSIDEARSFLFDKAMSGNFTVITLIEDTGIGDIKIIMEWHNNQGYMFY